MGGGGGEGGGSGAGGSMYDFVRLSADVSSNGGTGEDFTGMSFSAAANKVYLAECLWYCENPNGVEAAHFKWSVPSGATAEGLIVVNSTTPTYTKCHDVSDATSYFLLLSPSSGGSYSTGYCILRFYITTSSTAGTVQARGVSVPAKDPWTIKARSTMAVYDITGL